MERFEARFWDRVDGSGGPDSCWPWTGPVNKTNRYGYVTFWNGRKSRGIGAHRVAYVLAVGPVPVDLLVCHECDYRICCNPAHLWVGTYKDNGRDMAVKGRDAMMKLNPGKVRQIRARYAEGGVSQRELAGEYGVARAHISGVISGKFWGHVA